MAETHHFKVVKMNRHVTDNIMGKPSEVQEPPKLFAMLQKVFRCSRSPHEYTKTKIKGQLLNIDKDLQHTKSGESEKHILYRHGLYLEISDWFGSTGVYWRMLLLKI